MTEKLRNASLDVLPYAELTIKPGDTRPITIVIYDPPDFPKCSVGTADDMAEALQILGWMRTVVQVELNIRLQQEAREVRIDNIVKEGDEELPF